MNHTETELQAARVYAAQINRDLAAAAFDEDFGWASHITQSGKQQYADEQIKYAEEIEVGLHDGNFTIWQRMQYHLTGEMIAFLPEINDNKP